MDPSELADHDAPNARRRRRGFAPLFANGEINRLAAHTTVHSLAWGVAGTFWTVFLLRAGLRPAWILTAIAGILMLRFALRPLALWTLPILGPRRTLILGTFLFALQYPALALVDRPGPALAFCCFITALGGVFYWTCYHAFFAALGDVAHRGGQLGARQALGALAGVLGPAVGGLLLARFGPWSAFGAAAALEMAAALPLLAVTELPFSRSAPPRAYAAARAGTALFFTDGWISGCTAVVWDVIAFRALDARYAAFGALVAAAALAGAVGGVFWGRFIDAGHARRAVGVSAAIIIATLLFKAASGGDPLLVIAASISASLFAALYIPSLLTAFYNEAKASPCTLRFHFAAEGGWDFGGAMGCLIAAGAAALGAPLPLLLLIGIPGVIVQAWLLRRRYEAQALRLAPQMPLP